MEICMIWETIKEVFLVDIGGPFDTTSWINISKWKARNPKSPNS